MKYYRFWDDSSYNEGWSLGEINFDGEWDFWSYVRAGEVVFPKKELVVKLRRPGRPLSITFASFELLIVDDKAKALFSNDEVQFHPVKISGYNSDTQYWIMTIRKEIDCVDEEKSIFKKWKKNNRIRPDLAGQYEEFDKLVVDKMKCKGNSIFRIKNYDIVIVVSEKLKRAIEEVLTSGLKFIDISD